MCEGRPVRKSSFGRVSQWWGCAFLLSTSFFSSVVFFFLLLAGREGRTTKGSGWRRRGEEVGVGSGVVSP